MTDQPSTQEGRDGIMNVEGVPSQEAKRRPIREAAPSTTQEAEKALETLEGFVRFGRALVQDFLEGDKNYQGDIEWADDALAALRSLRTQHRGLQAAADELEQDRDLWQAQATKDQERIESVLAYLDECENGLGTPASATVRQLLSATREPPE